MIIVWRVTQRCNLSCPFCGFDRRLDRVRRDADVEAVARFGARARLADGWRTWLLGRTGRADLEGVAPACIAAASLDPGLLASVDCAVILTAHPEVDYGAIVKHARLIVDTRNALQGCDAPHVIRL